MKNEVVLGWRETAMLAITLVMLAYMFGGKESEKVSTTGSIGVRG